MTLVSISEAAEKTSYSHEHIAYLVRHKKITGRKSGGIWLVDLKSLQAYEARMQALGDKKFTPGRDERP